jgi:myosin heavy subunit
MLNDVSLQFYNELIEALDEQEFFDEERDGLFKVVAGVLHFGNVRFVKTDLPDGSHTLGLAEESFSEMSSEMHWAAGAEMWGVDSEGLMKAVTTTKRKVGGETIESMLQVEQAEGMLSALCKHCYSDLFNLVIAHMNKILASRGDKAQAAEHKRMSIASSLHTSCSIFLLDIFGFEIMLHNSVEQLCINFCNERLHNFFLADVFLSEEEEYKRQGIVDVPKITYKDNGNLLKLIAGKGGVFAMLAEEIRIPNGADDGFLHKLLKKFMKSGPPSKTDKPSELDGLIVKTPPSYHDSNKCFSVQHFAGVVPYNVTGWLHKNQDQVRSVVC